MNPLACFIRDHKAEILADWSARARALPSAAKLSSPTLGDGVPQLLDALADSLERLDTCSAALDRPAAHATRRDREGHDLREVIAEYALLRTVVFEACARHGLAPQVIAVAAMDELIDRAIGDAVEHHAAERDRTRELVVGLLGHDLRNPLSVITVLASTFSGAAATNQLDVRQASAWASRVLSAAAEMERMIADILDFARNRLGGGFPIAPVPMDLRTVLATAVDDLAFKYPSRDIQCQADEAQGSFQGLGDPDRLAQAITNLVEAALKHGPDPIVVDLRDEGEWFEVSVRNCGQIQPEHLPHLFEPLTSGTRQKFGLGLYIVREVARAHGGEVEVESSADAGTAFHMRLLRSAPSPSPS